MAAKRSIAFVANTSWSIWKFRLYLIEQLINDGFSIFILAPRDQYTASFEHLPGLQYTELTQLKSKSISPRRDSLLYRELLHHYRRLNPNLVFHYTIKANIYGSLAASRANIPSVSVITGLGYTFSGKGWLQTVVRKLYKTVLRHNAQVWFLNEDDRRFFTSRQLVNLAQTFLLPGEGVDTQKFFPAPYQPGKKEITFLLIGRLIRHKGIGEFVEASQTLRQQGLLIRCQVLGFFDENNPVAIPAHQLKEWTDQQLITYLGHTDDVTPFIEKADCIVLPSYREGLPLSLLEGASMCKALIASDTPGCRTIITPGRNGFLCQPRSATDLAAKMKAYYELDDTARKQMGLESRDIVLNAFTQEIVTNIYRQKIKSLLTQTQSPISSPQPTR